MDKSTILNNLEKLLPAGFQIEVTGNKYVNFNKIDNGRILVIGFGDIINGDFVGLSANISFINVESIIHSTFEKNPHYNNGVTLNTRNHGLIFNKTIGEGVYDQLPISLDTVVDLKRACELIQKFINQDAFPFFNYWQDIRDFLPFIETEDNSQVDDIFYGYGFYKKVVIWKLCSHRNFELLTKNMLNIFEKELKYSHGDTFLIKDFNHYNNILKCLEKVKPIYDWDENYLIKKPLETVSEISYITQTSELNKKESNLPIEIVQLVRDLSIDGNFYESNWNNAPQIVFNSEIENKLEWKNDKSAISFKVKGSKVNATFVELQNKLMPLGYYPFFSIMGVNKLDTLYEITIIKRTDYFDVLRCQNTAAPNYNLSTEDIIEKLQEWDSEYGVEVVGASDDWCMFYLKSLPDDIGLFIKEEIDPFCPDFIDQSAFFDKGYDYSVNMLADLINYQKIVYLWWD